MASNVSEDIHRIVRLEDLTKNEDLLLKLVSLYLPFYRDFSERCGDPSILEHLRSASTSEIIRLIIESAVHENRD